MPFSDLVEIGRAHIAASGTHG